MCTVLLPLGNNPTAVNKYIISFYASQTFSSPNHIAPLWYKRQTVFNKPAAQHNFSLFSTSLWSYNCYTTLVLMILVSGIYHSVPLSPFHPAAPISLAVQYNVILTKQHNTLPSAEGYCFIDPVPVTHWPILFPLQNSWQCSSTQLLNPHKHQYSQHNYTPHCFL